MAEMNNMISKEIPSYVNCNLLSSKQNDNKNLSPQSSPVHNSRLQTYFSLDFSQGQFNQKVKVRRLYVSDKKWQKKTATIIKIKHLINQCFPAILHCMYISEKQYRLTNTENTFKT